MKKILTILCITCMLATSAVAGTIKCEVTEVIEPILPEGDGVLLMECTDLGDIKVGDKVKVKTKKTTGAIEGC